MKVTIDSRAAADATADLLAVALTTLPKKPKLPPPLAALDRATGGQLKAAIASGDFGGGKSESLLLYPTSKTCKAKRIALLGVGDRDSVDADRLRRLAGRAVGQASSRKAGRVALVVPDVPLARKGEGLQALAEGAVLASYRFDGYRGKGSEGGDAVPKSFALLTAKGTVLREARAASSRGVILAESQNVARDLSNEPANALPPASLARAAQRVGRETGLRVKVLDETQLKKHKMGAILAVGGGSVNPPRLIVMEHRPPGKRPKGERPFCIVGKGITFDSGGISIKPSAGMDEMKHDMSGAASVVGAMRACALLKLPYPVIGVIGAAENMPSGTAYRPGDVVTAMSGKTIEVLNTDAEGRVVLADALHYARTEYDPCAMVDLATLTGACLVALGGHATGLFANHAKLSEQLRVAGETTAELAWPMPLLEGHKDEIRSQIGDIKNTGGRAAGASTAAAFLWHFAEETPWAHLDIAGTGWTSKTHAYQRRGATGVGVRLLLEMLRDFDPQELD